MNEKLDHEVIDLMKEIEEENPELKEVMEIVKTKQYKTLYNAIYKALKKAIDYAIEKNLFSGVPGKTSKPKKPTLEVIEAKSITPIEKDDKITSYMIKNDKGKIAFIGKGLVEKTENNKIYLNAKAQKWYTEDHIKWQEAKEE